MQLLEAFLSWAWARHHNVLSRYIRPLFLLPFCYFACRRSVKDIVLTLLALATSMFWFPEPEQPDPEVPEFLAVEKDYLTGDWTLAIVLMALLVPASLAVLALAFWKRSLFYGLAVIHAMVLTKIAWSFYYGSDSSVLCYRPLPWAWQSVTRWYCTSRTACAGKRDPNPSRPSPPGTLAP